MEEWIKEGVVELFNEGSPLGVPIFGEWKPEFCSIDWSNLYKVTKPSEKKNIHECPKIPVELTLPFFTSIRCFEMWRLLPVAAENKQYTTFLQGAKCFCFTKGPPGQIQTAERIGAILSDVCRQLSSQGVPCSRWMNDIVIVSASFDVAMRNTGRVHAVLKQSGVNIDGKASVLIPRPMLPIRNGEQWQSMSFSGSVPPEMRALFLSEVFRARLVDEYVWGGQSLRVVTPETFIVPAAARVLLEIGPAESINLSPPVTSSPPTLWNAFDLRVFAELGWGPVRN